MELLNIHIWFTPLLEYYVLLKFLYWCYNWVTKDTFKNNFSQFWQHIEVFSFMFGPSSGVFLHRIYNVYGIWMQVERSGLSKFRNFKNKCVRVVIIYFIFITNNMYCRSWRVKKNKNILEDYLSEARCRGILEFLFIIKKVWKQCPCIIVRNCKKYKW